MQPIPNGGMNQGPVICVPAPTVTKTYDRLQHKQAIGLGIVQVIIGVLCILFNSVSLAIGSGYDEMAYVCHGFWCGAMFIITGSLGISAGIKKAKCQIVAFLVMCILSAVITIGVVTCGIIGAIIVRSEDCDEYRYGFDYYYPYYYPPCHKMSEYQVVVAMEATMAILGFIEAVVAIWGSAISCSSGICCCCSNPAVIVPGIMPNSGQMMYVNQPATGQYVYVPLQTMGYPQSLTAPQYDSTNYAHLGWNFPAQPPPSAVVGNALLTSSQPPPEYPLVQPTGQSLNGDDKF